MPTVDSKPRRRSSPIILLLALLLIGTVCFVGLKVAKRQPQSQSSAANTQPATLAPAIKLADAPKPAEPGTLISADEVLGKLDTWIAAHPNYHATYVTAFANGAVMSKMDVFAYTNAPTGEIVKIKADVFLPQTLQFLAKKENGKLQVYFPRSNQLIEPDTAKMLLSLPAAVANQSGMKAMAKLAKFTFAEASADLQVVTLLLNNHALNLPDNAGDVFLSIRSNNEGKLLGMGVQAQGEHMVLTVKYLTFDRNLVSQEAPNLPAGKVAVTNKTLEKAMQEEARLIMDKPLGTKI